MPNPFPQARARGFQKISSTLTAFADFFFPNACFGCGQSAVLLCAPCSSRIPRLHAARCFLCANNITRFGEACYRCDSKEKDPHPLDAVFAATCYQVPIIKRMVHSYKYQFVEGLHSILGSILARGVENSALPLPDLLVPVPLHPKRLRYRGFNQSALLAEFLKAEVAALSDIPVLPVLQRNVFTKPQQKTGSKRERVTNLANAFSLAPGANVSGKILWLIDDVATTKSTLAECAKVLKNTGAKKIYAVVLARD